MTQSADWVQDVIDFHKAMEQPIGSVPYLISDPRMKMRIALIAEEFNELLKAEAENDLIEFADALADLIYVTIGTAVECGIDLRPVWDEVQRTNMLKKDGPVRADGKRLKPKGWKDPEIAEALKRGNLK